jgi:hypothetical protein
MIGHPSRPCCLQGYVSLPSSRVAKSSHNASPEYLSFFVLIFLRFCFFRATIGFSSDHLLTPFNGAVPPSNLLDKVARGVSQAKGAEEWPHSFHATRIKLMELARTRAKDARRGVIPEEDDFDQLSDVCDDVLKSTTNTRTRRPLYRQSSMDFVTTDKLDLKNNDNINR